MLLTVPKKPPSSCVGWWDSVIGLGAILIVFFALRHEGAISDAVLSCLLMMVTALTVGVLEITRAPWLKKPPSKEVFEVIFERAAVKFLGFFLTIAVVLFLYWLFPEYRRPYYNPFFEIVQLLLPWLFAVAAVYFLWAEWRIPQEKDGSWYAGLIVLGQWKALDYDKLKQYALGWLVKAYFLPIMFGDMANALPKFRLSNWNLLELPFMQFYSLIFIAAVTFELVFVAGGYLFTCRLFNSQIRSVENTLYGWFVAVISYAPLLSIVYTRYFGYRTNLTWSKWLDGHETFMIIWGSVILVLMVVHTWADACFGVRFSNLTNRGIITNGAYRFCKHPAYLIKNLRWWMVSVPFAAAGGWDEALRLSLLLVCVNILYTLRAATEEKLLSQDPTYVAYALWMDKHGWLRWVARIFPFIKYEGRLKKWLASGELKIRPQEYFRE